MIFYFKFNLVLIKCFIIVGQKSDSYGALFVWKFHLLLALSSAKYCLFIYFENIIFLNDVTDNLVA